MNNRIIADRLRSGRPSVLLLGPRQVGKTTLCQALAPSRFVQLADEAEFLRYSRDPATLGRELAATPAGGLVCIDEVQRVPSLLNVVQDLLDRPASPWRFILTGSSARKLRRGGANLLPGRIVLEHLDPLSVFELAAPVDLDRALRVGMLPGIYLGGAAAVELLGSYAQIYLREEIRAEALTRSIGAYARFLDAIAVASGGWINYSKLAADVEVPKETLRRFVALLEDTLLVFRIEPFRPAASVTRRVTQRDRLLLFDVGVRNALLGMHRQPLLQAQVGPVFEQWFILQVIYLGRALQKSWKLTSYRSEAGAEVDLVVERPGDRVAIEIKASRNVGRSDARGLRSLAEIAGGDKPLRRQIAYLGPTRQRLDDGVEVLPYLDCLEGLRDDAP